MAKKYEPVTWFGILMGAAWIGGTAYWGMRLVTEALYVYAPFVIAPVFFVLCAWVLFRSRYAHPLGSIASTLLGFLYVPFLF